MYRKSETRDMKYVFFAERDFIISSATELNILQLTKVLHTPGGPSNWLCFRQLELNCSST